MPAVQLHPHVETPEHEVTPRLTEIHERGTVHSETYPYWNIETLRHWHQVGFIRLYFYTVKTPAGHRQAWTAVFTNWEHT